MSLAQWLRRRAVVRRSAGDVEIGEGVLIARGARVQADAGASLSIEDGCKVGPRSRVLVRSGHVRIGAGSTLAERASVIAVEAIEIEPGVRVGELAVLMDFDVLESSVDTPLREHGVSTAAVRVGCGAVIGARAVVGAGAVVRPGAHILEGVSLGGVLAGGPSPSRSTS